MQLDHEPEWHHAVSAYCRRIRDDDAFWKTLEQYLETQAGAQVSHGICPACASQHCADL